MTSDPGSPDRDPHLSSLLSRHPHAAFRLDLAGNVIEVNPAAGEATGYSTERLIRMHLSEIVSPADLDEATAAFLAAQRTPQHRELGIVHSDGREILFGVTAIPVIEGDAVVGVYGIAEERAERAAAGTDVEIALRMAATATAAKSDFVARMSHDIRTPLTSILAAAELLEDSHSEDERQQLADIIRRSGRRLLQLVDHVLDFSAVDGGTAPNVTVEFDLHALIHDAVALVGASAQLKGLTIELDLDPAVPRRVRDHPTWTSQILVHLLSNAVSYTDSGTVRMTVTPAAIGTDTASITYRIVDTGRGIPPERLSSVFDPFTRLSGDVSSGAGLGLSIVDQLVTISGGTISLTSTPGGGTTVTVLLPVRPLSAT